MTKKVAYSEIKIDNLKSLREKIDMSQDELARLLTIRFRQVGSLRKTISQRAISDWERGVHSPRLTPNETLELCNVLNCTLLQLVDACRATKEDKKS